jgi:hypothetical protein
MDQSHGWRVRPTWESLIGTKWVFINMNDAPRTKKGWYVKYIFEGILKIFP